MSGELPVRSAIGQATELFRVSAAMAIERRRVFFSGHVQGVGFRMTTRRLATGLPIVGFVRNLADGRVELLIEGDSDPLDRLTTAIQREFGASIRETAVTLEALDVPPLVGFAIR